MAQNLKWIKVFVVLIIFIILLAACRSQTPEPTPTPETVVATEDPTATRAVEAEPTTTTAPPEPTATEETTMATFSDGKCPFQLPEGQVEGDTVECGTLTVPMDRADPGTGTIELAVAIFHSEAKETAPDPVIYLEGGPGGSPLEFIYLSFERVYQPMLAAGRDLIIFDQRGVGYSTPVLDCPEEDELYIELLDNEKDGEILSEEEMNALNIDAMTSCASRLAKDVDLADFNTDENAADVNDLRLALGYEQVNLWGISYGTRLALEVMRDYPEGLRAVILDSVYPPDVDLYATQPANMDRAFSKLFEGCAAEAACNASYPDLRQVFFDTAARFNEENAQFKANDPLNRKEYDVAISGDSYMGLMFNFLYDSSTIPSLPKLIYDASQDKFDLLGLLVGSLVATSSATSDGMYFAVQCREEIAFGDLADSMAAAADFPDYASYFDEVTQRQVFDICADFPSGKADAAMGDAVSSDIPALVMAGEYDPATPPGWAEQAARTLSDSHYYEFAGVGHGASVVEGCPQQLAVDFVMDPTATPADDCVSEMTGPTFYVPSEVQANLVPYVNETFGLKGVIPEGWEEVNPGVYSRGQNDLDLALIITQAAPIPAEQLFGLLIQQFGLAETPAVEKEHTANGYTWKLYRFSVQGLPVDMAITDANGTAIVVLLQSSPEEREDLYDIVFLPVIDSLMPME